MKYKPRQVEIEAIQFDDVHSVFEMVKAWGAGFLSCAHYNDGALRIHTKEGEMLTALNDYIIKGTHGEFYPCNPNVFRTKYEPVE